MSSRWRFPSGTKPALLAVLVPALSALSGAARADDNLLHGPHPFRKENQLAAHVLIANGLGDSMSGTKIGLDYGYRLTSGALPLGVDLAFNMQHGACTTGNATTSCGQNTGTVFETLAGVRWAMATPVPLVPFVALQSGFVFSFPNGASAGWGVAARGVTGANYFFFDWFGLGAQLGFSLGRLNYDATFTGSHTYAIFDLGGGIEIQF
jgi:hypothetical protein